VSEGQGCVEQRARHLINTYFDDKTDASYERVLAANITAERRLEQSVQYERIVIWSEYDPWDQFMQLRFLAHYASVPALPRLELINVDRFQEDCGSWVSGSYPPKRCGCLWKTRRPATAPQPRRSGLQRGVRFGIRRATRARRASCAGARRPTATRPALQSPPAAVALFTQRPVTY